MIEGSIKTRYYGPHTRWWEHGIGHAHYQRNEHTHYRSTHYYYYEDGHDPPSSPDQEDDDEEEARLPLFSSRGLTFFAHTHTLTHYTQSHDTLIAT